ncbi:MAG: UDP-N-acetylglucosamine 2-epimerase (non-hydrolyzing) [Burkholderiales bacterium PBB4]|nr:MAG: UDP-N-acetylglucosamine 2-epimerase (non-hydrolyzing) [Burkholderiales bacterium PBB4]
MKKLKVLTVVGTRPEIIRLSRVLPKLDAYCDHSLIHTGQNYDYELSQVFFEDLGLRAPDRFLGCAANSSGPAQTIGNVISAVDQVLAEIQPDALLVLGDTNSCLAVIPAKRRKIPIFHMEAGNRCFDQRVPEETNRRIVDHTADVNMTYSDIARNYLLREGLPPDLIIKTGSPMHEVLSHNRVQIDASDILTRLKLDARGYFVVSAHREENIDTPSAFAKIIEVINAIALQYGLPVIVSTHPRTLKKIEATDSRFHPQVSLLKPLGFHDYVKLQLCSRAVLSDSGTISEEASILGFHALNLREAHERPEAMEEAAVMMVGVNVERVCQGLNILADQPRGVDTQDIMKMRQVNDYSAANVSEKVVRIIHSYTDYVNRVVWKKY